MNVANRLSDEHEAILRETILSKYFGHMDRSFFETEAGRADLNNHLTGRLDMFRNTIVPWLAAHMSFPGARILEIGAGTGSSTVALAEKGAFVDAIDIDDKVLEVTETRARLHGLDNVRTHCSNATELQERFGDNEYDLIIFFASLEHMTHSERQASLRAAWSMLKPGALLSVFETPNRLWYYDGHTSLTPFFHWLPDEVAIDYSVMTPRDGFNSVFNVPRSNGPELLARWGRGISYHDFELAIGKLDASTFVSGMQNHYRRLNLPWAAEWGASTAGQFHKFLCAAAPHVPPAFLEEELDILLRK